MSFLAYIGPIPGIVPNIANKYGDDDTNRYMRTSAGAFQ